MRRETRWIINGLFIVIGCILAVGMAVRVRRQDREERAEPLEGFEVFCSGEEISALYPAGDSLWVGGRDGVKRLDIRTGELIDYVAEDLELIYAAEIIVGADGAVWVGHNAGVTRFSLDGKRQDFTAPALTGGRVNTLLHMDDRIWVGTMEGASLLEEKMESGP